MKLRMAAAVLSLIGIFISAYLWLYKLGRIGSLACGTGGCETVQRSGYSAFLGVDVALIGLVGYAAMFTVALAGTAERQIHQRWPASVLASLAGVSVLFAAYLTWLEVFVIHALCRWCVVSALIVSILLILSLFDLRRLAHDHVQ